MKFSNNWDPYNIILPEVLFNLGFDCISTAGGIAHIFISRKGELRSGYIKEDSFHSLFNFGYHWDTII